MKRIFTVVFLIGAQAFAATAEKAPRTKVLVIGLDAAAWSVADPLIERGLMPNLGALKARGAWGELQSLQVRHPNRSNSAAIWTSLATGKLPERHGITGFIRPGPEGRLMVMTSADRREPAFWNALSGRGLVVGVVGWWATWPAEPVNGEMVSYDFWPARRDASADCQGCTVGSRPGRPPPPPRATWPEGLAAELQDLIVYEADLASAPAAAVQEGSWGSRDYWPYARDVTMSRVAERLLASRRHDVFAVYFESLDIVSHQNWICRAQEGFLHKCSPGAVNERWAGRIDRYYEFIDEQIGRLVAAAGPGATVVVVSDHGFQTYPELRDAELKAGRSLPAMSAAELDKLGADVKQPFGHSDRAIVLAAGPGIAPGRVEGTIYDFAPTLLRLAGAPAALDMDGRPLTALLPAGPEIPSIPAYPPVPKISSDAEPADRRALIERLQSLGYLSGSVDR
jgi:predicted AlkP superfamily phosphohydrolase/phosphomutase